MAMSVEKYFVLFPVFVAFLSIFLVLFCLQRRRKHDAATLPDEVLQNVRAEFSRLIR